MGVGIGRGKTSSSPNPASPNKCSSQIEKDGPKGSAMAMTERLEFPLENKYSF